MAATFGPGEYWPWVRVVAFSGDSDDALVARATDVGVDIFLPKESPSRTWSTPSASPPEGDHRYSWVCERRSGR